MTDDPTPSQEPDAGPSEPALSGVDRTIALVGLMGVGKSSIGRRLAAALHLPFVDGDAEIETAAGMSISDIFADFGEAEFRAGEARVIKRVLEGPPVVLATGGGAVLNPETRARLRENALTVWLKADLPVIVERVGRRDTRPLLRGKDPLETLTALAEARYPLYAEAHVVVEVGVGPHAQSVEAVLSGIAKHLETRP